MSHVCDRCGGTLRVEIEQPTITDGWLVGYLYLRTLSATTVMPGSGRVLRACLVDSIVSVCQVDSGEIMTSLRDGHKMTFNGNAEIVLNAIRKHQAPSAEMLKPRSDEAPKRDEPVTTVIPGDAPSTPFAAKYAPVWTVHKQPTVWFQRGRKHARVWMSDDGKRWLWVTCVSAGSESTLRAAICAADDSLSGADYALAVSKLAGPWKTSKFGGLYREALTGSDDVAARYMNRFGTHQYWVAGSTPASEPMNSPWPFTCSTEKECLDAADKTLVDVYGWTLL